MSEAALKIQTYDSYIEPEELSSPLGPLDLLLQLIREQKMDIFKIDIYKITSKYVEYLKSLPIPDLENAGDFIRMASLLMHIKSRTLLPKEEQEDEETSQLKEHLVRLLVNYQRYQTAAGMIYKRNLLDRDTWSSRYTLVLETNPQNEIEIPKEKASFLLIKNYNKILQSQKIKKPHKTRKPLPSLLDRIKELNDLLVLDAKINFNQLSLFKTNPYSRLLTFLSILELSKLGFVSLVQKSFDSDINIEVKKNLNQKDFTLLDHEEKDWMDHPIQQEAI
ncbi:MAG: segregation and condensation protein A [Bdellovibrionales bacterium]